MAGKPLVSIIIPVFNYAHYLKRALDSVFKQTFRDYEVIVVDDGSDDDPLRVIEPYGSKVQYYRQQNQGVCAARNAGVKHAAGEYILFLDADDYVIPDKLNAQIALMKVNPNFGIVHSGWWLVDKNENVYDCITPWDYAPRLDLETWLFWKPVFPGAMLLRKSVIESVGGFDPAFTQAEDVDLVFRMMLTGCEAIWLKRPTAYYRQHPDNTIKDSLGQTENMVRVLDKFFIENDLPKSIRNLESRIWYSSLLWNTANLFEGGHLPEVKAYLQLASEKRENSYLDLIIDFFRQLSKNNSKLLASQELYDLFIELISNDQDLVAWAKLDIHPRDFLNAFGEFARVYHLAALSMAYDLDPDQILQLTSRQIVKIISMQIIGNTNMISSRTLHNLWLDLRKKGLIPDQDRYEVLTLFLTLFSKSVFSRNWSRAVGYFVSTLLRSFHPRAFPPWYRFFLSAKTYAVQRMKRAR